MALYLNGEPYAIARLPRPGTAAGDQKRDEFEAAVLRYLGNPVLLWVPRGTETTTSTDRSRYAATLTYNATFAGQYVTLGSGRYATFDGSTDEADTPDADRYSPGDSVVDLPMTIVALVNPDDGTPAADMTILSRWNLDTDGELREWRAYVSATNGYPIVELYDESANTYIGRQDQTALTDATWVLLEFVYDGSRANGGIVIRKNGAVVDDADSSSGTYVAMENLAVVTKLAHSLSAAASPVAERFWDGGMALVGLAIGKATTIEESWELKAAINAYHDLSL